MIIIVIIITIVIIIFMIIIFDLMRSLNLTPSGIPLGLRMFYGPFLARAINRGSISFPEAALLCQPERATGTDPCR